jgi:hypothetical protein
MLGDGPLGAAPKRGTHRRTSGCRQASSGQEATFGPCISILRLPPIPSRGIALGRSSQRYI